MSSFIFAFLAIIGFCVVFESPLKCCIPASLIGATGWIVYLALGRENIYVAGFMASVVIAIFSDGCAVWLKVSTTSLFVPGILPIVPGTAIYRAVSYFVKGKYSAAGKNFVDAVMLSGSIALAIVIVDYVFYLIRDQMYRGDRSSVKCKTGDKIDH